MAVSAAPMMVAERKEAVTVSEPDAAMTEPLHETTAPEAEAIDYSTEETVTDEPEPIEETVAGIDEVDEDMAFATAAQMEDAVNSSLYDRPALVNKIDFSAGAAGKSSLEIGTTPIS